MIASEFDLTDNNLVGGESHSIDDSTYLTSVGYVLLRKVLIVKISDGRDKVAGTVGRGSTFTSDDFDILFN